MTTIPIPSIARVKPNIYNKVGVRDICRDKINACYQESMDLLDKVGVEASYKKNLSDFVLSLMNRNL